MDSLLFNNQFTAEDAETKIHDKGPRRSHEEQCEQFSAHPGSSAVSYFLMNALEKQLLELEQQLADPSLRRAAYSLVDLLAEEFVEFGSSGRVYDKLQTLKALRQQTPRQISIEDFRATKLADAAALVTYRALVHREGKSPGESLHSSVWIR